jgi:hypothetical protein
MSAEYLPQTVATLHQLANFASLALQTASSDVRFRNGIALGSTALVVQTADYLIARRRGDEAAERTNVLQMMANPFVGYMTGYLGTELIDSVKAAHSSLIPFLDALTAEKTAHDIAALVGGAYVVTSVDVVQRLVNRVFRFGLDSINSQRDQIKQETGKQHTENLIKIHHFGAQAANQEERDAARDYCNKNKIGKNDVIFGRNGHISQIKQGRSWKDF